MTEAPDPLQAVAATVRERHRAHPGRLVFGFAGPPGSGKSTVVERLAGELGPELCVVVPMDGFHLANRLLAGTPLAERKGAVDTFDAYGYLQLLQRLRAADEPVVYAPAYERAIEEPVAGAIAVPAGIPVVLTEGNYLLLDESAVGPRSRAPRRELVHRHPACAPPGAAHRPPHPVRQGARRGPRLGARTGRGERRADRAQQGQRDARAELGLIPQQSPSAFCADDCGRWIRSSCPSGQQPWPRWR